MPSVRWGFACACAIALYGLALGVAAQSPAAQRPAGPATQEQIAFFESRIRPILADRCYKCHSEATGSLRSSLALDWRGGWEEGGLRGPAIVAGDPENSLLIEAVRHAGDVKMPPDGKLPEAQVNDLIAWVKMGAPDPRTSRPAAAASKYGGSGKNHWAFQPVTRPAPPPVKHLTSVKNDIDRFVLARLESRGMTANPPADKRTLIRRAYFDLIGLPPTPEQVNAFLADASPNAFDKVVDGLLASPHYGERWGRHWLDVARYADSKGQPNRRRDETPLFPYAWTYRDYVIRSLNNDLPYDQFIREQLAADLLDNGRSAKKDPSVLAALGFLTLGDRFNGNRHDVINDRIDVTSKAFLGLTVSCARCHDHKFDPIPTADYYSLYGIFASSVEPETAPIIAPPNAANASYLARRAEMDARLKARVDQHVANLFGDPSQAASYLMAMTQPENQRVSYLSRRGANPALLQNWVGLMRPNIRAGIAIFQVWTVLSRVNPARFPQQAPRVLDALLRNDRPAGRGRGRGQGPMGEPPPEIDPIVVKAFRGRSPDRIEQVAEVYGQLLSRTDPEWEAAMAPVWEAALLRLLPRPDQNQLRQLRVQSELLELTDRGAPARAHVLLDGPRPADAPIFVRGQAETPGQIVPRRFLEVLSGASRPHFDDGSGRLQLANAIASKTNPLTPRVIVNRVWQHHFGSGLISTPDDLGTQSAPPTHPELLDWLANRFVSDGWSLKKLHRLILQSATWQQSSRNNPAFAEIDPFNQLLWRANIRRLEFEPLRDSILAIGGSLDLTVGGHPIDLAGGMRPPAGRGGRGGRGAAASQLPPDPRRTVYGFVDRANPDEVLNTFDVATPNLTTGKRYETTVPQQALFLMNSPLVIEQVRTVVNRDEFQDAASDEARIGYLYELFFQRPPNNEEIRLGKAFVAAFQSDRPAAGAAPPPASGRGARGAFLAGRGGRGQARLGGRGAPPVRVPLTGWQEYAHALLLTNEASFVN